MEERQYLPPSQSEFRFYSDSERLANALAAEVAKHIRSAVANRGVCHMVFPGGRSPYRVLERLRDQEVPWSALHLYPSDERCVSEGSPERNDRLIDEILLPNVPLPHKNLHRIPAELGPEEGAVRFSQFLASVPTFDIVMVGVGPDGHIASLFPNHPALFDDRDAVPVLAAPKLPPSRVSIGLGRLKSGHSRQAVAIGAEKRRLFENPGQFKTSPVMGLNATIWYAD